MSSSELVHACPLFALLMRLPTACDGQFSTAKMAAASQIVDRQQCRSREGHFIIGCRYTAFGLPRLPSSTNNMILLRLGKP